MRRDGRQRSELKIATVAQSTEMTLFSQRSSLYLRSLVAAGYSPRSIEAGRSDLAQFAEFLSLIHI